MLYNAYEVQRMMLAGMGEASKLTSEWLLSPANPFAYVGASPVMARALEVFAHAAAPRGKPAFGLNATIVDGVSVAVSEEIVLRKPFGQLKHFVRAVSGRRDPKLLIVAPMSGALRHPATRHGRADAARPRRLCHRLARREDGPPK